LGKSVISLANFTPTSNGLGRKRATFNILKKVSSIVDDVLAKLSSSVKESLL
jgi:hypothetical protein